MFGPKHTLQCLSHATKLPSIFTLALIAIDDIRVLWEALCITSITSHHLKKSRIALKAVFILRSEASLTSRMAANTRVAQGIVEETYRLAVGNA